MKREIFQFVSKCLVKAKHQAPSRLLQPIMIPQRKWERVTMDFVSCLPLTPRKKDAIWVIVDRFSLDKLAELNVSEIVKLHGVPMSIIYYHDSRFTSRL
ncbi:integrase [Gossypium australe]|uniref:Integrase n=1 Tax=Gossypium australe TaxID=47621 RepID=A0A5B6VWY1_9ROSI|nr:integrase [Gossypium australe]